MTHRFQRSNQTIRLSELDDKLAIIEVNGLTQKMPLCDPQACGACLEGRCQITWEKTDETKICIPNTRSSVER